jgi:hypothetical protein
MRPNDHSTPEGGRAVGDLVNTQLFMAPSKMIPHKRPQKCSPLLPTNLMIPHPRPDSQNPKNVHLSSQATPPITRLMVQVQRRR